MFCTSFIAFIEKTVSERGEGKGERQRKIFQLLFHVTDESWARLQEGWHSIWATQLAGPQLLDCPPLTSQVGELT